MTALRFALLCTIVKQENMVTQNGKVKTGRKPNTWKLLKFADIADHLTKAGTPVTQFVKTIGVSNQTFHNWKNNRCAPAVEVQQRIKDTIEGILPGEKTDMAKTTSAPEAPAATTKKKTKKSTKKAARGKGSVSLAALAEAAPVAGKDFESVAVIIDVTKAKKKKAGRRPGPRKATALTTVAKVTRKAAPKARGTNGTSSASPTTWSELSTLGIFLRANPGKSREELAGVIDVARELLV